MNHIIIWFKSQQYYFLYIICIILYCYCYSYDIEDTVLLIHVNNTMYEIMRLYTYLVIKLSNRINNRII
jgi:hypothetical protein